MSVEGMSRDEVFVEIRKLFVEMFELEPHLVTPSAEVFGELDLDSIDAVDLVAKLHEMTGQRLSEAQMRAVISVEDIVQIVLDSQGGLDTPGLSLATSTGSSGPQGPGRSPEEAVAGRG